MFECVTTQQPFLLPRTYVIIGVILLATLVVLYFQRRMFANLDD